MGSAILTHLVVPTMGADQCSERREVRPQLDGIGDGQARVPRGGSWADSAGAVTVSFRVARPG